MAEQTPLTVIFGEMTALDEAKRRMPMTNSWIRVPFSIAPAYTEHQKGHFANTLRLVADEERGEDQRPLELDRNTGKSVLSRYPVVADISLTHTIGETTFGKMSVNAYDPRNIAVARHVLTLACKRALDPLENGNVAVRFTETPEVAANPAEPSGS